MKQKGELWRFARHRRGRWLNNRVEQDHRRIKRLTRPMLGFQGFWTAKRTLAGIEAMACWLRDRCVPCPGVTYGRSDPLYSRSSALRPEQNEAVEQRALYRQCNRSRPCRRHWRLAETGRHSPSSAPGRRASISRRSAKLAAQPVPVTVTD